MAASHLTRVDVMLSYEQILQAVCVIPVMSASHKRALRRNGLLPAACKHTQLPDGCLTPD